MATDGRRHSLSPTGTRQSMNKSSRNKTKKGKIRKTRVSANRRKKHGHDIPHVRKHIVRTGSTYASDKASLVAQQQRRKKRKHKKMEQKARAYITAAYGNPGGTAYLDAQAEQAAAAAINAAAAAGIFGGLVIDESSRQESEKGTDSKLETESYKEKTQNDQNRHGEDLYRWSELELRNRLDGRSLRAEIAGNRLDKLDASRKYKAIGPPPLQSRTESIVYNKR